MAALPAEMVVTLVFYDPGRAGFKMLDQFGQRGRSGETDKDMDMICDFTDLKWFLARNVRVDSCRA